MSAAEAGNENPETIVAFRVSAPQSIFLHGASRKAENAFKSRDLPSSGGKWMQRMEPG
ncbi:hypothetical protein [Sinorhizobium sp. RAC02]|uniref:hypothetical protein n=1 Tax=Sinorhizobium sp. RAC02 TaxID=1842534 RepID=UPI0014960527|nr:hypothetical protein [Sinorhizobium sp. RAC02]